VLHPNTNTIVSLPRAVPFVNVNLPETVNVVPACVEFGVENAVSDVERGLLSEPVLRFNVIFPGPLNVTRVGSFEPEQVRPLEQLQLHITCGGRTVTSAVDRLPVPLARSIAGTPTNQCS